MTILYIIGSFMVGYYIGKRMGITIAMMHMEGIINDLQKIQTTFKQWNEDNL